MSKNLTNFCSNGYFEVLVKTLQKGLKIYNSDEPVFLVKWFLTYGQSINFLRLDEWWIKHVCLHHEGSMIGVQCH